MSPETTLTSDLGEPSAFATRANVDVLATLFTGGAATRNFRQARREP